MIDPRCRTSVGGNPTAAEMKINLYEELQGKIAEPSKEPDRKKRLSETEWDMLGMLELDPVVVAHVKARIDATGAPEIPDQDVPLGSMTEAAV